MPGQTAGASDLPDLYLVGFGGPGFLAMREVWELSMLLIQCSGQDVLVKQFDFG
jgi:hypothetical protein